MNIKKITVEINYGKITAILSTLWPDVLDFLSRFLEEYQKGKNKSISTAIF